jgi:hypothetical protein
MSKKIKVKKNIGHTRQRTKMKKKQKQKKPPPQIPHTT